MFSGSLPRGSSNTPVNGKIGRMAGSAVPPRRSLIGAPSGKHGRGKPPSAAQGQRVGRTHYLEEFEELLAGGLFVPFAIAFEQGEQLVNAGFPLSASEQSGSELESRLVVVRTLRQPGPQLAGRTHRLLRLLGEIESGAGRSDLGVSDTLLWNTVEKLLGLGEFAACDRRPGETAESIEIGGLALQDLGVERTGTGMVALL